MFQWDCAPWARSRSFGHKAIIGNKVVPYGACTRADGRPPSTVYDKEYWEYIGSGDIYEISNVKQGTGFGCYHFYVRRNH